MKMADRGHFLEQWHLVSLSGTVGDLFGDLFSRCAFQVGLSRTKNNCFRFDAPFGYQRAPKIIGLVKKFRSPRRLGSKYQRPFQIMVIFYINFQDFQ